MKPYQKLATSLLMIPIMLTPGSCKSDVSFPTKPEVARAGIGLIPHEVLCYRGDNPVIVEDGDGNTIGTVNVSPQSNGVYSLINNTDYAVVHVGDNDLMNYADPECYSDNANFAVIDPTGIRYLDYSEELRASYIKYIDDLINGVGVGQ